MKNNKILLPIASAVLAIGFLLFSLEKLQVTNFYEKPVTAPTSDSPRPVNSVDYTPQTSPPDPTVNSEKNQTSSNTPAPTPSNITVSISRANQDPATRNLNVGVLVDGTITGTCKLELIQNNIAVLTKTAAVTEQSGLATCAGFTVLASEIPSAGSYIVKVSVGDASASQNKDLIK
jgi:hypothetical protein